MTAPNVEREELEAIIKVGGYKNLENSERRRLVCDILSAGYVKLPKSEGWPEIQKAHTHASENADVYDAHEIGQKEMSERCLAFHMAKKSEWEARSRGILELCEKYSFGKNGGMVIPYSSHHDLEKALEEIGKALCEFAEGGENEKDG